MSSVPWRTPAPAYVHVIIKIHHSSGRKCRAISSSIPRPTLKCSYTGHPSSVHITGQPSSVRITGHPSSVCITGQTDWQAIGSRSDQQQITGPMNVTHPLRTSGSVSTRIDTESASPRIPTVPATDSPKSLTDNPLAS